MTFERINPENLAAPIGFSHAVAVEGKRIVFLAGQTSMDKRGAIVGNGIVEQFERALSNLLISLKESGGAPSSLTKLTIFSVDPADYRAHAKEIGAVWKRLVGKDYPAMTLVGVTRLWDKEALIEIEGYAAI